LGKHKALEGISQVYVEEATFYIVGGALTPSP
jgi:hypothetical protein